MPADWRLSLALGQLYAKAGNRDAARLIGDELFAIPAARRSLQPYFRSIRAPAVWAPGRRCSGRTHRKLNRDTRSESRFAALR